MKRIFNYIASILMIVFTGQLLQAQTTNTGELTIMPGTIVSTVEDFVNTPAGVVINDGDFYIYRSFQNDGEVDYVAGGLTRFAGFEGVQVISGENRSYFYDVLFQNETTSVPFHLEGIISVANQSDFISGIVDNEDYGGLFVFEQNGYHTGTSDFSHVDGFVLKEGSTAFLYPIGDGGYFRFASITAPDLETDMFEGKYTFQNSNTFFPHENKEETIDIIDNAEYWVINRSVGASEVILTLSWSNETTPLEIIDFPEADNIHIVRWDAENNIWIDEGGVVDVDNQTVTAVVTGYGVFTLAKVRNDEPDKNFVIYNFISPNGDNFNDFFFLEGIEDYPLNNVKIYNRWGVKVYDKNGYDNETVRFEGVSEGRATLNVNDRLPDGTYFYVISFKEDNPGKSSYAGFLYIQNQ